MFQLFQFDNNGKYNGTVYELNENDNTDLRMTTVLDNVYTRKKSNTNFGLNNDTSDDKQPYIGNYSLISTTINTLVNGESKKLKTHQIRLRAIEGRNYSNLPTDNYMDNSIECFTTSNYIIDEGSSLEENQEEEEETEEQEAVKTTMQIGTYVVKSLPHYGVYGIINPMDSNKPSRIRFGAQLLSQKYAPDDYPKSQEGE